MTREDIIKMARAVRDGGHWNQLDLINFAYLVSASEREACAKVCDEIANKPSNMVLGAALDCAAAIRARGEK